ELGQTACCGLGVADSRELDRDAVASGPARNVAGVLDTAVTHDDQPARAAFRRRAQRGQEPAVPRIRSHPVEVAGGNAAHTVAEDEYVATARRAPRRRDRCIPP